MTKLIKKFRLLIDEKNSQETNNPPLSNESLKALTQEAFGEGMTDEALIESMFSLWKRMNLHHDGYLALMVRNQIIEYVKDQNQNYGLYLWYFIDDSRPFFIDLRRMDEPSKNKNFLWNITKDYPSESLAIIENITFTKAVKYKKQLLYYCLISNIQIMRFDEEYFDEGH